MRIRSSENSLNCEFAQVRIRSTAIRSSANRSSANRSVRTTHNFELTVVCEKFCWVLNFTRSPQQKVGMISKAFNGIMPRNSQSTFLIITSENENISINNVNYPGKKKRCKIV